MKIKTLRLTLTVSLITIVLVSIAFATVFAQTTTFTYQGFFEDGGSPATGAFDLQFELYDADTGGTQIGSTLTSDDVMVVNGYFNVDLDFGAVFNGDSRWLEISVRPGADTGAYTLLSPRIELTPVPYAIYGEDADADPTNEVNTGLFLTGTVLSLVDGGGTLTVDLESLNDDPRTPISAIPLTINQPGSYYLTQNLTNTTTNGDGIRIDVDDVTLDLNGYTLSGGTGSSDDGIVVLGSHENIYIKNGTVRDWNGDGINALNADASIFENLHAENNGGDGVVADFGAIILNCTSSGNGLDGLEGDDGTIIKNSTASGNDDNGIQTSEGSIAIGNSSANNGTDGVDIAAGSVAVNNSASGNVTFGFDLALGSLAHNNSAYANGSNGFDIASASQIMGNSAKANGFGYTSTSTSSREGYRTFANAYLINNVAEGNSEDGFHIASTDTYLDGNYAFGNGEYGIIATSSGSFFISHSAAGNTTGQFSIVTTSAYGQILTGTATTDQPFANFTP